MTPLIRAVLHLLTERPQVLASHAQAYAELAGAELGIASTHWRRRGVLMVLAALMGGLSMALAGVAVMLWAMVPAQPDAAPWALVAVPLLPLVLALGCAAAARHAQRGGAFKLTQAQWRADLALLSELSTP